MNKVVVVTKNKDNGPYLHEDVEVLDVINGEPSDAYLRYLCDSYSLEISDIDWSTWEVKSESD